MRVLMTVALTILPFSPTDAAPKKDSTHIKTAPAPVHQIPETGVLDSTDLVGIARLQADTDQFSEEPTLKFVGRNFALSVDPKDVSTSYDRNSQRLTVSFTPPHGSLELAKDVKRNLYSGQNAFGAKATVIKATGDTFGVRFAGSRSARDFVSYSATMDGASARELSKAIRLRVSGQVTRAKRAETAVVTDLSAETPTVSSPIDKFVTQHLVCVSITSAEWIDARSGAIVGGGDIRVDDSIVDDCVSRMAEGDQRPKAIVGSKLWLQLATGSDRDSLLTEFARIRARDPDLFAGIVAYVARDANQSRLVIGPFRGPSEAQLFADDLKAVGVNAVPWSNSETDQIVPLQ
jgi:hypothetical protein